MFPIYKELNWEILLKLLIKKGDKIKIKETGEIKEVIYTFYYKNIDMCKIDVVMDKTLNEFNKTANRENYRHDAYKTFKLPEIEKV